MRASRGSETVPGALRAVRWSGWAFVLSCLVLAVTHETVGWVSIVLIWAGHVTITGAELWQSAAGWGFASELSDHRRLGDYQGVWGMGGPGRVDHLPGAVHLPGPGVGGAGLGRDRGDRGRRGRRLAPRGPGRRTPPRQGRGAGRGLSPGVPRLSGVTAQRLDGTATLKTIKAELTERVALLKERGVVPGLGTVLVGDDPGSHWYVGAKHKDCAEIGIESIRVDLPATATQAEVEAEIDRLNADPACTGFLVQQPTGLDEFRLLSRVDPDKDVDGLHPVNLGKLVLGEAGPLPCTPIGCIELLRRHGVELDGAHVVVVGRGLTVGRPLGPAADPPLARTPPPPCATPAPATWPPTCARPTSSSRPPAYPA